MIVYAVICRAKDAAVLVECSSKELSGGNAAIVTSALLEQLKDESSSSSSKNKKKTMVPENSNATFVHRNTSFSGDPTPSWANPTASSSSSSQTASGFDFLSNFRDACSTTFQFSTADEGMELGSIQEHYFHIVKQTGVYFCCLSDDRHAKDQKVNFDFLQAIAKDFSERYTARKIKTANAYSLDKDFGRKLQAQLHYYNTHHESLSKEERVQRLETQISDMKQVLGQNVQLLLERETKLSKLVNKSEMARRDSQIFQRKAKAAKQRQQWMHYKYSMLLCLFVSMVLYVILVASCGFRLQHCQRTDSSSSSSSSGGRFLMFDLDQAER